MGTGHDFSDTTSNGTTAASESDMSLRNSIIIRMGLAEKQEKDLRKKLRTLYEIRVAEQTMSLAKEQGKKTHPNLIEKVDVRHLFLLILWSSVSDVQEEASDSNHRRRDL